RRFPSAPALTGIAEKAPGWRSRSGGRKKSRTGPTSRTLPTSRYKAGPNSTMATGKRFPRCLENEPGLAPTSAGPQRPLPPTHRPGQAPQDRCRVIIPYDAQAAENIVGNIAPLARSCRPAGQPEPSRRQPGILTAASQEGLTGRNGSVLNSNSPCPPRSSRRFVPVPPGRCCMARILLIDDDADLGRFLQLALEERGHFVEWLERADGTAQVLGRKFDVVLLDNKMPGMSGMDLLARLQEHGLHLPVILMTGHSTTDTAIQAMNLGAFDYVVKPLDYDALLRELEALIG